MAKDKQEDLQKYSNQIKELLRIEIVTRYYFQKGKVEAALQHDPDLDLAVATINDQEKYTAILSGKYIQPKPEVPVRNETEDDEMINPSH